MLVNAAVSISSAVVVYLIFALGEFLYYVGAEPAAMHAELEARYKVLRPLLSIEFNKLTFGQRGSLYVTVARLKIFNNSSEPTTLHEWSLCTEDRKTRLQVGELRFDGVPTTPSRYVRLESSHVTSGFLEFNGVGDPTMQWILCFKDSRNTQHEFEIPKSCYSNSF